MKQEQSYLWNLFPSPLARYILGKHFWTRELGQYGNGLLREIWESASVGHFYLAAANGHLAFWNFDACNEIETYLQVTYGHISAADCHQVTLTSGDIGNREEL